LPAKVNANQPYRLGKLFNTVSLTIIWRAHMATCLFCA